MQTLFITGATGYIGTRLMNALIFEGFRMIALVRPGSEHKIPAGIEIIVADVFKPEDWISKVPEQSVFIHLIGVPHPSPVKKQLFESVDLRAARIVALAAKSIQARKFIFLSVAMEPSAIMKEFQKAKSSAEEYINSLNLPHVFVRPWYVLGPGHWWPYLFFPLFKLLECIPSTAKKAKAFGFITIRQMINSLKYILKHLDEVPDIVEIEEIKRLSQKLIIQSNH